MSKAWSKEEDAILFRDYPTIGADAEVPNRSKQAKHARACVLGIKCLRKRQGRPKGVKDKVERKERKRTRIHSRSGFGYIPGGPVRSVFELGEVR